MKLIVIKSNNDFDKIRNINDNRVLLFLTNNIEFNDDFIPINLENTDIIIFGNGYYINGLTINREFHNYNGLFSKVNNLYVRDLEIKNSNIKSGEVCGSLSGEVIDTLNARNVKVDTNISADSIVGGLAGITNHAIINDCEVSGLFMARGIIGGLVGMSESFDGTNNRVYDFNAYIKENYPKCNIHNDIGYLSTREDKKIIRILKPLQNEKKTYNYYME